jgi:hypothetical protein
LIEQPGQPACERFDQRVNAASGSPNEQLHVVGLGFELDAGHVLVRAEHREQLSEPRVKRALAPALRPWQQLVGAAGGKVAAGL